MKIQYLQRLILSLEQKRNFNQWLKAIDKEYYVKVYNIQKIRSNNVLQMYSALVKKYSNEHSFSSCEFWCKNQLKIFTWLLFAYSYVLQKNILYFAQQDWNLFSSIFNKKKTQQLQFQARLLIKQKVRQRSWSIDETRILQSIINDREFHDKWNKISRELFFRSNKLYFRNPKQCREQWKNHIDPSKFHSKWTQSEDLTILQCIKNQGKKWSLVVNVLKQTRTEHMVKNRYKSLIRKQQKKHKLSQCLYQIQSNLIKKLTKSVNKKQKFQIQLNQEDQCINFAKNISKQFEDQNEFKNLFNYSIFEESKNFKIVNSIFDLNLHESVEDIYDIDNLLITQTVKQSKRQKFDFMEDLNNCISLNMLYNEESNQQKDIIQF